MLIAGWFLSDGDSTWLPSRAQGARGIKSNEWKEKISYYCYNILKCLYLTEIDTSHIFTFKYLQTYTFQPFICYHLVPKVYSECAPFET